MFFGKFEVRTPLSSTRHSINRRSNSIGQEAKGSTVDLVGDDPQALEVMLRYLYGRSLHKMLPYLSKSEGELLMLVSAPLSLCAHIYAVADKYGIVQLKKEATEHYSEYVQQVPTNIEDYIGSVRVCYSTTSTTDRGLRSECLRHCIDSQETMLRDPDFTKSLSTNANFAAELAQALSLASISITPGQQVASMHTSFSQPTIREYASVQLIHYECEQCHWRYESHHSTSNRLTCCEPIYYCHKCGHANNGPMEPFIWRNSQ